VCTRRAWVCLSVSAHYSCALLGTHVFSIECVLYELLGTHTLQTCDILTLFNVFSMEFKTRVLCFP
jgi:hypothetical protein